MPDGRFNVLFLCTGNSARSIMAEALLNFWAEAVSTRSAREAIRKAASIRWRWRRCDVISGCRGFADKSWDESATPDAPPMDFVFTVCDNAAAEVCPTWPGQPMTAHWGIHDPAAVDGTEDEQLRAFNKAFRELDARLKIFTSLRVDMLDKMSLQRQLDAIGQMRDERQLK